MASMDQIQGFNRSLEAIRAEIATIRAVGPALETALTSAIAEVGQRAMNDISRVQTSVDELKKTVEDSKSILDKTNQLLNGETAPALTKVQTEADTNKAILTEANNKFNAEFGPQGRILDTNERFDKTNIEVIKDGDTKLESK